MNQIIVIGHNSTFSKRTNQIAWLLNGVLLLCLGIIEILRQSEELLSMVLSFLLILGGVYGILYASLGLSKSSKFSSKIKLSEKAILIKKSFWKTGDKIDWAKILHIEFKPYQIIFQLNNSIYNFDYETNTETSIEIKRAIRKYADLNNISVTDG